MGMARGSVVYSMVSSYVIPALAAWAGPAVDWSSFLIQLDCGIEESRAGTILLAKL